MIAQKIKKIKNPMIDKEKKKKKPSLFCGKKSFFRT